MAGVGEQSMWCGGRTQQADIIKASQWLAEHLGLEVVVLSDAAALRSCVSAPEVPSAMPREGVTTTPSSCNHQPSAKQENGPQPSDPRAQAEPHLNGSQAACAIKQLPVTTAIPAAHTVQKDDIVVGASADSEDGILDDLLAGAPEPVSVPASAAQAAARGLPPGHRPLDQLLSDSEDGDDFLDGLLDDEPPPAKSFESKTRAVSSRVLQSVAVGAATVACAVPRQQATCMSSDQVLDDLLGSETSMEAGELELNADSGQDEAQKHHTIESPAKEHIPKQRHSERHISNAASVQHPPAASEQQVSAGAARGIADDLLDSLMAEDVVHDQVSHRLWSSCV